MARRMFSDEITTSDAFLDMPTESQTLYFHLGMSADDDGFISNTKMVQRVIGASDDSLKLLFAKKFLLAFENGVCVVKHWRINNFIRKDIYRATKYQREKSQLFIRENGAYTKNPKDAQSIPNGHFTIEGLSKNPLLSTQNVNTDTTLTKRQQNGYVGKVRIGKDSIEHNTSDDVSYEKEHESHYSDDFESFWKAYPKKVGKGAGFKSWKKIKPLPSKKNGLFQKILDKVGIQSHMQQWTKDGGQFIPNPATYLNQRRWEDEVDIKQQKEFKF